MTPLHLYGNTARAACFTCGAPSDGWFADGSPSWKHSHPRPYYSDDAVTLYHGDAGVIVPTLARPGLLVLDPPFDVWESVRATEADTVIAFTSWQHRRHVEALYGIPRTELVWSFDDGRWVSHNLPRITHETILVYGATGSVYVGDRTDGIARNKGAGHVGRTLMPERTYIPRDRKALGSVLAFPRDVSTGVWTKPLPLVQRLIEWTWSDGYILDPYAGSGTTLVAAKSLGHKVVGVEIDEQMCEMAANRCRQDVLGLSVEGSDASTVVSPAVNVEPSTERRISGASGFPDRS